MFTVDIIQGCRPNQSCLTRHKTCYSYESNVLAASRVHSNQFTFITHMFLDSGKTTPENLAMLDLITPYVAWHFQS